MKKIMLNIIFALVCFPIHQLGAMDYKPEESKETRTNQDQTAKKSTQVSLSKEDDAAIIERLFDEVRMQELEEHKCTDPRIIKVVTEALISFKIDPKTVHIVVEKCDDCHGYCQPARRIICIHEKYKNPDKSMYQLEFIAYHEAAHLFAYLSHQELLDKEANELQTDWLATTHLLADQKYWAVIIDMIVCKQCWYDKKAATIHYNNLMACLHANDYELTFSYPTQDHSDFPDITLKYKGNPVFVYTSETSKEAHESKTSQQMISDLEDPNGMLPDFYVANSIVTTASNLLRALLLMCWGSHFSNNSKI